MRPKDNDFSKIMKEMKQTRIAVNDLRLEVNRVLLICTDQIKPLADNVRNIYLSHDITKEIAYYKSKEYQEAIRNEYRQKLEEQLKIQQLLLVDKPNKKKKRVKRKPKQKAAKFINVVK